MSENGIKIGYKSNIWVKCFHWLEVLLDKRGAGLNREALRAGRSGAGSARLLAAASAESNDVSVPWAPPCKMEMMRDYDLFLTAKKTPGPVKATLE